MNIKGQGGEANTLKFNLHIIGRAKKRCEFNPKMCEFKILLDLYKVYLSSRALGVNQL